MCYEDKDRPPLPPGMAGAVESGDLTLRSEDGTEFLAFEARPAGGAGAQVLIYPDIRGLHGFYKDLAVRFGETGTRALAMDYFGRTAGVSARGEDFEWQPHVAAMTVPQVLADTRAALAHLRQGEGASRPTFVLGFCRGGSLAYYAARMDFGLAGIVGFYSGLARTLDETVGSPVDAAREAQCPVLGLFGGADAGIPPEQVQALDAALDAAGVRHEIITYPGAPHSFFDRKAADYAEASADAWQRVLAFIAALAPA
jgi:carboxymethylenebutenolidase